MQDVSSSVLWLTVGIAMVGLSSLLAAHYNVSYVAMIGIFIIVTAIADLIAKFLKRGATRRPSIANKDSLFSNFQYLKSRITPQA